MIFFNDLQFERTTSKEVFCSIEYLTYDTLEQWTFTTKIGRRANAINGIRAIRVTICSTNTDFVLPDNFILLFDYTKYATDYFLGGMIEFVNAFGKFSGATYNLENGERSFRIFCLDRSISVRTIVVNVLLIGYNY